MPTYVWLIIAGVTLLTVGVAFTVRRRRVRRTLEALADTAVDAASGVAGVIVDIADGIS